jgi:hypothetical protein
VSRTWILTGSPENHAATREHDWPVIGLKVALDESVPMDRMTAAAGARA